MKVKYYCGLYKTADFDEPDKCCQEGTINVDEDAWKKGLVSYPCPSCGLIMIQGRNHFQPIGRNLKLVDFMEPKEKTEYSVDDEKEVPVISSKCMAKVIGFLLKENEGMMVELDDSFLRGKYVVHKGDGQIHINEFNQDQEKIEFLDGGKLWLKQKR